MNCNSSNLRRGQQTKEENFIAAESWDQMHIRGTIKIKIWEQENL